MRNLFRLLSRLFGRKPSPVFVGSGTFVMPASQASARYRVWAIGAGGSDATETSSGSGGGGGAL